MPVNINWFIPQRVILLEGIGHISTEDIIESAPNGAAMIESSSYEVVHILFDAENLTSFARDVFGLTRASQHFLGHPRFGWFILYGREDPIVRFTASITTQVFRRSFKIFVTKEEALTFLDEILRIDDEGVGS